MRAQGRMLGVLFAAVAVHVWPHLPVVHAGKYCDATKTLERPAVGETPRLPWGDKARALVRANRPVVIVGSDVLGKLTTKCNKWSYLQRAFGRDLKLNSFIQRQGRFRYGVNLPEVLEVWPNARDFTWWENDQVTLQHFRDFNKNPPARFGKNASMYIQDALERAVGYDPAAPGFDERDRQARPPRPNVFWRDFQANYNESFLQEVYREAGVKRLDKTDSNLWISAKNSCTPAHYDIVQNLFVQCAGMKRVTLFPPDDAYRLYTYPLTHPSSRQTMVDIRNPDLHEFPNYAHARPQLAQVSAGDLLFLPAYWWHEVDAVSNANSNGAEAGERHDIVFSIAFWNGDFYPHRLTPEQRMGAAQFAADSSMEPAFFGDKAALTTFAHKWSSGQPLTEDEEAGKRRAVEALTRDAKAPAQPHVSASELQRDGDLGGMYDALVQRFGTIEQFLFKSIEGRYGAIVEERNRYVASHEAAHAADERAIVLANAEKLDESLKLFEEAAALAPDRPKYHVHVLQNLLDLAEMGRGGSLQAAVAYVTRLDAEHDASVNASSVELVAKSQEEEDSLLEIKGQVQQEVAAAGSTSIDIDDI